MKNRNLVYHYTNTSGIHGILESRSLHLTPHDYLNDLSERKLVLELLPKIVVDHPANFNIDFFSKPAGLTSVEYIRNSLEEHERIWSSTASFSLASDSLNQWQHYGEDNGGYAIGFDRNLLERFIGHHYEEDAIFGDCIYDTTLQEADLLTAVNEMAEQFESSRYPRDFLHALSQLFMNATKRGVLYKNKCFEIESEYRIAIFRQGVNFSHKVGNGFIKPYFPLILNEDLLSMVKEIWIGPRPDETMQLADIGLNTLINKAYKNKLDSKPEIYRSLISFRHTR